MKLKLRDDVDGAWGGEAVLKKRYCFSTTNSVPVGRPEYQKMSNSTFLNYQPTSKGRDNSRKKEPF